MSKIINFPSARYEHSLCLECPKNERHCPDKDEVCLAIEVLRQLCLVTDAVDIVRQLGNVSQWLDLEGRRGDGS